MDNVKVGFIGAGGNASGHMEQVNGIEGAKIVAVCDVMKERADERASEYEAKAYADYRAMLDQVEMDALYVSVPPFAHTEAELIAAEKGVHLFVEKPVALTLEKALEINRAIEQAGVLSCVGYQLRYGDTVDRAKQFLQGRTIAMVTCNRWGGLPPTPWWKVMAKSGGQLVEQTTHNVDMMRCLAGEIVEVYANYALRTLTDVEGLDVPDVGAISFRFESGAIGSLTTSCALTQGGGTGDLNILVKDAVLKWAVESISADPGEYLELSAEVGPAPSIDAVFIEAVKTGDGSKIRSPYSDALRSLDVTLAANRSAREGKPVQTYYAASKG
ncbi:MAG: Gfo/Idh/MocA family oxidoreductase [Candidatus Latescibacteria bacterium]|nr:Gfo/Idh/MocA family oxidoreductase [Candidatus Latescibacterota bacterium]